MENINISLPQKIVFIEEKDNPNKASVIIEPCYPGYGTTIGNSLRRVLLSSIPGAAVTAVKIKGVLHEFSTIPYVKEDVIEIILNLKSLRLKIYDSKPVILSLKVKGEKKATAKDIKTPSNVEVVNPDFHIATLTDKKANLEMEIYVQRGLGYVPTETQEEKLEIGAIAIDSIFTPIKNINIRIENIRVGQRTDYDKLILDIETDGTISPKEVFIHASKILLDHFNLLTSFEKTIEEIEEKEEKKEF